MPRPPLPIVGADIDAWGTKNNALWTDAHVSLDRLDSVRVNVGQHGAVGDGVTNDTAAIRAAIAAVQTAGGGVVYFPRGTYKVWPAVLGEHIFAPTGDNITFRGEGKFVSIIDCFTLNGAHPDTGWQLFNGAVWRGSAFYIPGHDAPTLPVLSRQHSIRFERLGINGNASFTTNETSPALTTNGDGWDVTHKGVYLEATKATDDIVVDDCHIHNWRGEGVYGGGGVDGHKQVTVRKSLIHNCADSVSVASANLTVIRNEFHTVSHAGIENSIPRGSHERHEFNWIHDCPNMGVSIFGQGDPKNGTFLSHRFNVYERCNVWGLRAGELENALIEDNWFIDCGGDNGTSGMLDLYHPTNTIPMVNTFVRRNHFIVNGRKVWRGIVNDMNVGLIPSGLYAGIPYIDGVHIKDNDFEVTRAALAAGHYLVSPVVGSQVVAGESLYVANNLSRGSSENNINNAQVYDSLLTGTAFVELTQYRAPRPGLYRVSVAGRVLTGTTNVTVVATYTDTAGTEVYNYILGTAATPVAVPIGGFSVPDAVIWARGTTATERIKIEVKAGTANQVRITARITEVS